MAMHAVARGTLNRPTQNRMRSNTLPSPINGMDGRLNLAANDPSFAIYAYNMVPSEYGVRTREGFREYQISVGSGTGVRTLVPFNQETSQNSLFAITNEGIWDVTVDAGTPSLVQAFTDTGVNAGWASYAHYTDQAGNQRLFVADEANGLFMYDGTTWSVPAITGVDPANLVFVVLHKLRLWFVERDTTTGWYLDVGAIAGPATPFYFGAKLRYGGDLVGLYNWTRDSGSGVDDFLVAISRAGDVIPYRGSDPSAASTWDAVGTYYIGDVPQGRRVADEFSGNLHILSTFGLVSMADLLNGLDLVAESGELSQKIGQFLRTDMATYLGDYGWEIRFNTSEATMVINTPVRRNGDYIQYRMHMGVKGWAFWRGVPMLTGQTWRGRFTFGTADNRVMRMDVTADNVQIADPEGDPIDFSLLTAYTDLGEPTLFKWGDHIRVNWLATQPPSYESKFLYDFSFAELGPVGVSNVVTDESLWDVALWDQGVWASGRAVPQIQMQGGWGPGRTVAVALRGKTFARTTLANMDVMWHTGGPF